MKFPKLHRLGHAAGGASSTPSSTGHGGKIAHWVAGHKPEAAAGAAGVVVVALAMHSRSSSAGNTAAGARAATSSPVAGLSGTPAGQPARWPSRVPHAPRPPAAPPPIPRPGAQRYTIHRGDTLQKIAVAVYGTGEPWTIRELKRANPILAFFAPGRRLDNYAGDTIRVPAAHHKQPTPHGRRHPEPKPPREPKPRRERHPRGKHPHREPHPRPRHPQHQPHPHHEPQPHGHHGKVIARPAPTPPPAHRRRRRGQ